MENVAVAATYVARDGLYFEFVRRGSGIHCFQVIEGVRVRQMNWSLLLQSSQVTMVRIVAWLQLDQPASTRVTNRGFTVPASKCERFAGRL